MKKHVHIFGASGAGTTTIAKAVSQRLGYRHFDADEYFWLPTEEPFTVERDRVECLRLLGDDLQAQGAWVLSGSLAGWGEAYLPCFDLAVFVYVPADIRLERLRKRECERYGGSRPEKTAEFLAWAAAYDEGNRNGRSLQRHEAWLGKLTYKTVRVVNLELADSIDTVLQAIQA